MKACYLTLIGGVLLIICLVGWWALWASDSASSEQDYAGSPEAKKKPLPDSSAITNAGGLQTAEHPVSPDANAGLTKNHTHLPDLKNLSQRRDYHAQLKQQSAGGLWSQWTRLQVSRDPNDVMARQLIATVLSINLRTSDSASVYPLLETALLNSNDAVHNRVAQILTRAATPQALQILLNEASRLPEGDRKLSILKNIEETVQARWDSRFHTELSPPLEAAWQAAQNTQNKSLLRTTALALAHIGHRDGVAGLFAALPEDNTGLKQLQDNEQFAPLAAFSVMRKIRNLASLPILENMLNQYAPDTLRHHAAGLALSTMGRVEASQVLFVWAQQASEQSLPQIEHWFNAVSDTRSNTWLLVQFEQGAKFKNDVIKEKLQTILRNEP